MADRGRGFLPPDPVMAGGGEGYYLDWGGTTEPEPPTSTTQIWDGSAWVGADQALVWSGAAWEPLAGQSVWDGAVWRPV